MTSSIRVKPLQRYKNVSPSTRLFLEARWRLTPYSVMASKLPTHGTILDLGCGHGLFSLALALSSKDRKVVGLDHDTARIDVARAAAEGVSNLEFSQKTLSERLGDETAQGISLIDVMHYFPLAEQESLFKQAFERLAPGGVMIVREVNPNEGMTSKWNRLYEKIATTTGFTQSEKKADLHFRTREGWTQALKSVGFEVESERCSAPIFADILYVCRKPNIEGARA